MTTVFDTGSIAKIAEGNKTLAGISSLKEYSAHLGIPIPELAENLGSSKNVGKAVESLNYDVAQKTAAERAGLETGGKALDHISAAKEIGAELGQHVKRLFAEADTSVSTDGPTKGGGHRR